jgi:hypothetical protein
MTEGGILDLVHSIEQNFVQLLRLFGNSSKLNQGAVFPWQMHVHIVLLAASCAMLSYPDGCTSAIGTQVAAGPIKDAIYALGGDSTEAQKVLSTAGVKQAEIDQQLQFFSSVGPIGKVHKEGTSVRLEKTAPANLEGKQHMQIQYAKLDIKLEEVFPAAMLRKLAGGGGGTGAKSDDGRDGDDDEDYLGGVFENRH